MGPGAMWPLHVQTGTTGADSPRKILRAAEPLLTRRGHGRPQLMVESEPCCYHRGCLHICLMQNSLTYKRLVLFMNINELEMGIEKIILHEEMTEMIKFRKHLTRDLHNMYKENDSVLFLFKKQMVPSFSKTL